MLAKCRDVLWDGPMHILSDSRSEAEIRDESPDDAVYKIGE
jgi:hypothetical protein